MRHINLEVFCESIFTITFFCICVSACGTQPIKKERAPKEKVKSITFLSKIKDKQEAPIYMFPVDQYLWTFYEDRLVVHSKNGKKVHFYKEDKKSPCIQKPRTSDGLSNLEGHTDCIPRLKLYRRYDGTGPITRLGDPRGIVLNGDKVVVRFTSRFKLYGKDGTYSGKEEIDWKKKYVHKLPEDQKLLGFRSDPEQGNIVPYFRGKSGSELFRIGSFFHSGDWLLMHESMKNFGHDPSTFKYENTKIHLVYRPTGDIVKTIRRYAGRYRVREYGTGFYVDKLVGQDILPYLWFGKYIWNLEEPNRFCYVKDDVRRCVQNNGPPIRAIIHNKFFRATIAGPREDTNLYLEWK